MRGICWFASVGIQASQSFALWTVLVFATPGHAATKFDTWGQCVGDADGDGQVTVNELVQGVNNLLEGCEFENVRLEFAARVGSEEFRCGQSYSGLGSTGVEVMPSDFRFYVSEVRLVRSDGALIPVLLDQDGIWQLEDIALLDFENKEPPCSNGTVPTNRTIRGRVAPGAYVGVRFTLGVPFRRNHGDASVAPPPLSLTGMFWNWQDGYKFLRIDTALDAFRIHLGSTGCFYARPGVIGGCSRPNRAEVLLQPFDWRSDLIVADLAALVADSDLSSNAPDTPPGCMSDPVDTDCAPMFRNLGIDFASGLPTSATQRFFQVESAASR